MSLKVPYIYDIYISLYIIQCPWLKSTFIDYGGGRVGERGRGMFIDTP